MDIDNLIHIRENSDDTQRHLEENLVKFKGDCLFVFRMMMNGRRFSAQSLVTDFKIADRRLRDLWEEREYIKTKTGWEIKKEWKLKDNGKRDYVEYFAVAPKPHPIKKELVKFYQPTFNF